MEITDYTFFLAPMAEMSTPILRKAIKKFSSNVVLFSEMLSAKALLAGGIHNSALRTKYPFDDPFVFQITGNDPGAMGEIASELSKENPIGIDINMGCPMHELVKRGWGAKLLQNFDLSKKIIKICRRSTSKFLSVKMRTGYETHDIELVKKFISMFKSEGVDFITVHGRYARLAYKRISNWSLIKDIKQTSDLPVIGNGDITSAEQAIERLQESQCDGVMIGRHAVAKPWIFRKCNELLGIESPLESINIQELWLEMLNNISIYLPDQLFKSRSHRLCMHFSQNITFSHDLFKKIRVHESLDKIKDIINIYFENNPEERILCI